MLSLSLSHVRHVSRDLDDHSFFLCRLLIYSVYLSFKLSVGVCLPHSLLTVSLHLSPFLILITLPLLTLFNSLLLFVSIPLFILIFPSIFHIPSLLPLLTLSYSFISLSFLFLSCLALLYLSLFVIILYLY